jgi:hypothetical protein
VTGGGVERLQPSIIKDEQIGAPERAQNARVAPVAARQGEIFEKLGHAVVEHRPIVTAGFVAERRRQPALADAGRTDERQIIVGFDPFASGELLEERAVKTARTAIIDVLNSLVRHRCG